MSSPTSLGNQADACSTFLPAFGKFNQTRIRTLMDHQSPHHCTPLTVSAILSAADTASAVSPGKEDLM